MKKILMTSVAVLFSATTLFAQDVTIATGKEGGGYHKHSLVVAEKMTQSGFNVSIQNKNGSDETTKSVCNGSSDLAYTQIDAVFARSKEGCSLIPVGVYGKEYAMIFFPPKSKNNKLSDLTENSVVMVDTVGSGSALFWNTIVSIENGEDGNKNKWAKAKLMYQPYNLANAAASLNQVDAAVMVRKLDSKDVSMLLEQGWTVGYLYDKDIDDTKFGSKSLYESEKIKWKVGHLKISNYGYVVSSVIVANDKLANDQSLFLKIAAAIN